MPTRHCTIRRAFSAAELLPVATIIGVIVAIVVPAVTVSREAENEKINAHNIASINSAVERWYIEKGEWPASIAELESDPDYFPHSAPINPVTGHKYRLNAEHRAEDSGS